MDWCVEPEIAHDEEAILDRISGTVRLNIQCLNGADRRGIADRFVPVIQGWHPEHYLRCLERMPFALDFPLVGVGSMCRRHVDGEYGILHVLDVLDRAFNGSETRFHLFGLKSQGMSAAPLAPTRRKLRLPGLRRGRATESTETSMRKTRHARRRRHGTLVRTTVRLGIEGFSKPISRNVAASFDPPGRLPAGGARRVRDGRPAHLARSGRDRVVGLIALDGLPHGLLGR